MFKHAFFGTFRTCDDSICGYLHMTRESDCLEKRIGNAYNALCNIPLWGIWKQR